MSSKGTRSDNIERDGSSPKEGAATMAENDEAMTPDGTPGTASEEPAGDDGGGTGTQVGGAEAHPGRTTPYRDEEE